MRYWEIISEDAAVPTTAQFKLDPKLDPKNYRITGSFADVESWRVMTYVGDDRVEKGEYGEVGYCLIDPKRNTIIPISHGDEHHEGWDMIHRVSRKWGLKTDGYASVCVTGTNFIHGVDKVPMWMTLIGKIMAWGSKNGIIKGGYGENMMVLTYEDFLASGGNVTVVPGKLAPIGQRFYDMHIALQNSLVAVMMAGREGKRVPAAAEAKPFRDALAIVAWLAGLSYHFKTVLIGDAKLAALRKAIDGLRREKNFQGLDELFFGFKSVKRDVHERIRHLKPNDIFYREEQAIWGDLELAEHMLAHI